VIIQMGRLTAERHYRAETSPKATACWRIVVGIEQSPLDHLAAVWSCRGSSSIFVLNINGPTVGGPVPEPGSLTLALSAALTGAWKSITVSTHRLTPA
jgi:hypothetical protein